MSYGFDVDRLLVWVARREPDSDPWRAGSLCTRHADAMVVPIGWTLDDRRDTRPRLFRTKGAELAERSRRRVATPRAADGRFRSRTALDDPPAPEASDVATTTQLALDAEAEERTVAAVTGEVTDPADPDATVAIPWIPTVLDDDLGGLLAAESPLLARAFQGRERRH